jgi:hypothetical protein
MEVAALGDEPTEQRREVLKAAGHQMHHIALPLPNAVDGGVRPKRRKFRPPRLRPLQPP